MDYLLYLNKILLPVTPSAISIKARGKNETFDLIDGSEINILRVPGLKEINFEFLLPQRKYPFAIYQNNEFEGAEYYINAFEKLRAQKQPFQFILTRLIKNNGGIDTTYNTNLKVSIEELEQTESCDHGQDVMMSITLKEHVDYGTKTFKIENSIATPEQPDRPSDPVAEIIGARIYTVKEGDSLWGICARELGNGELCWDVATKNGISNPNSIYIGQKIDLSGV